MRETGNSHSGNDFCRDAAVTVGRVQDLLSKVITHIPNFIYRRPNDIATALGIDPKLAWRIGRCIEDPDPLVAAQLIPGPAGIRTFLQAVTEKQVPIEQIDAVRHSLDRFTELVRTHAGSRKNFNMLATSAGDTNRSHADVEHRRKAFEGNSYVWGVHARTIFRCNVACPSSDPDLFDWLTIRGYVDFCGTRPNVAWRITSPSSVDDKHTMHAPLTSTPVEPKSQPGNTVPPLLHDFCSQPLPRFRSVVGPDGRLEYEFVAPSVGNTARLTCITGEVLRRAEPRFKGDIYHRFATTFPVRLPAEFLVFDVLVHRDLFTDGIPLKAELFSDLFGGGPALRYESTDLLSLPEPLRNLGTGLDVARTSDIPRYSEMLHYVFDRIGWPGDQFDVYRLRMRYPPIPTTAKISRQLPEAPPESC